MLKPFLAWFAVGGAAAALAFLAAPQDAGAQTLMRVLPDTVRVYVNTAGFQQVDALVAYQVDGGEQRVVRAGVAGCKDGRGMLAQVGPDGAPLGQPIFWATGGTRNADALAAALCAAGGIPLDLKSGSQQI